MGQEERMLDCRVECHVTEKIALTRKPRIAIASSGLGHISRGIESWAETIALALRRDGLPVRLFQGSGVSNAEWREVVPCLRRVDPLTVKIVKACKKFGGWHFGLGSGYSVEQASFAMALWPRIASGYDILHIHDPQIARIMDVLHRAGLSRPRVILGHGTEEDIPFLQKISNLEHLALPYMEEYRPYKPKKQLNFAVPNFVDANCFVPGAKDEARERWNLPQDAMVFLCVAAIRKPHKRIDYLIEEFAAYIKQTSANAVLVIAGARESDTDELYRMGVGLLKDRVHFFENVPRQDIISLYQASDVFVLTSLIEMFGTVLVEAMSTGLPVICHDTPVFRWIVGPAGFIANLSKKNALANVLKSIKEPAKIHALGLKARNNVLNRFSEPVVVEQMKEMYREVLLNGK
jgi:glycosyltransferase involved in cell wall biosynthesis